MINDYVQKVMDAFSGSFPEFRVREHSQDEKDDDNPEIEVRVDNFSLSPESLSEDGGKTLRAYLRVFVRDWYSQRAREERPPVDAGKRVRAVCEKMVILVSENSFNADGFDVAKDVEAVDLRTEEDSQEEEWVVLWYADYLVGDAIREESQYQRSGIYETDEEIKVKTQEILEA